VCCSSECILTFLYVGDNRIALSRKPFEIGHVHIHSLLKMIDTMTSQNTDLSSWDILDLHKLRGKVCHINKNLVQCYNSQIYQGDKYL
jgi:hypothetical protein